MSQRSSFQLRSRIVRTVAVLTGVAAMTVGAYAATNVKKTQPTVGTVDTNQTAFEVQAPVATQGEPIRMILGGGCPQSTCTAGVGCDLTHNTDTTRDGQNTVACGVGSQNQTTANAWARCFDRADEGMEFLANYSVESITFGVQQAEVNCVDQQDCDENGGGICTGEDCTAANPCLCEGSSRTWDMTAIVYVYNPGCPHDPDELVMDHDVAQELCRKDFSISQDDASTPIPCTGAEPGVACAGGTDEECQAPGHLDAVCNDMMMCETAGGNPLNSVCVTAGGDSCGVGTDLECDGIATIVLPVTVDFDEGMGVISAGRDFIIELISNEDGTEPENNTAIRLASNPWDQCAPTYLRGPNGDCSSTGWDDMDTIVGFPEANFYMEVAVAQSGDASICGNEILENCEQCDPPSPSQEPGDPLCDSNCRIVTAGHPLAGDCCDLGGTESPGCSDQGCSDEICATDPPCCDTQWDDICAESAIFECADVGEVCEVTTALLVGGDSEVDGYTRVAVEATGAWASATFSGQGDNYNPAGDPPVQEACFSDAFWLFSAQTQDRGVLSQNPDILGVQAPDTATLEVAKTAEIVREDLLYGDELEDTATSAFDITSLTLDSHLDLSVDVWHQLAKADTNELVTYITQEYTFTNNAAEAVDFVLVRYWDADLVWDADEDFANDTVGTVTNGTDCDPSVFEAEVGLPETAVTMSSPDAVAYFGSKGGIRPERILLDGGQAGTGSSASGEGTVSLDMDTNTLTWDIDFSGLGSASTTTHFHGPAFPGETAGPVDPPVPLVIDPPGGTSGSITGSQEITDDQEAEVNDDGSWYVNIHSTGEAGGEIRGQVGPAYGFGTDVQEWQHFGVPNNWRNNIASIGYEVNGESEGCIGPGCDDGLPGDICDPCDGHVGLEIPVSLAANGDEGDTVMITIVHTYGSQSPRGAVCNPVGGECGDCEGELTSNGSVGAEDLAIVLGNWGECVDCCADFSGNDNVGAEDLAIVLGNWGACD